MDQKVPMTQAGYEALKRATQGFSVISVEKALPVVQATPIAFIVLRSMLGFKSISSARIILDGIEMVHMMRKRQARFAYNPRPLIAEQFEILAA